MTRELFPFCQPGEPKWRPILTPFRAPSLPRTRKAATVQMELPGMSLSEALPAATGSTIVCPNCGGAVFDADGDCTTCWEPGVAKANPALQGRRRHGKS